MANTNELHVVLGAFGGVGHAVVSLLAAQGKHVRAVNRSGQGTVPAHVELMANDLLQREQVRRACEGASVVYHCAGLPYEQWVTRLPPMLENILAATQATGGRLVYADNCYMYAPTSRPMSEELPYTAHTRKGQVRKQLAERVLAAHTAQHVQAAIGRATDFYGPGVRNSTMGERFFPAVLAGKRVEWLGKLDQPHAMTFVDDFARGLIVLGEREEALGQVWHIPAAEPLTGQQYIDLASRTAGVPSRPMSVSALMIQTLGLFNPTIREVGEMLYEFNAPYLIDATKYLSTFGGTPTPHQEVMAQTIAWYRQHLQHTKAA